MKGLYKVLTVMEFTFYEVLSSHFLWGLGIALSSLGMAIFLGTQMTYGIIDRMAIDIGLGLTYLMSCALAIFLGRQCIRKEIDQLTLYMTLSRPISRGQFLGGKILGGLAILCVEHFILSGFVIGSFLIVGGIWESLIFTTVIFMLIEAIILFLLANLLALFLGQSLSLITTVSLWISGHTASGVMESSVVQFNPWMGKLLKTYFLFFPNFEKLNLRGFLLYKQILPTGYIFDVSFYAMVYMVILVILSLIIFEKKDLT